jgi:Cu+-exporting ATPase
VDIYVASGDSMRSLACLSKLGISLERITAVASPRQKRDLVVSLKGCYGKVVMVGDGMNDLQALNAADLGVLTVQQDSRPPQKLLMAADTVVRDIRQLPESVRDNLKQAA